MHSSAGSSCAQAQPHRRSTGWLGGCFLAHIAFLVAALGPVAVVRGERVRCDNCHVARAAQLANSVHATTVTCQDCHGGKLSFDLAPGVLAQGAWGTEPFDHGRSFTGKPARTATIKMCGECHADVATMNAYGLPTDQLAAYRTSGHGKRVLEDGDENAAVCIDCHGSHDILSRANPRSRTYFSNIPGTCASCHAEPALMDAYGLAADIVDQYSRSVHGRRVLERGDAGSPTCATCHGSHGAAPPGFAEVGHVCGKCHQQIENYFASAIHGRLPVRVKCVACHGGEHNPKNHFIDEATPPPDALLEIYAATAARIRDPDEIKSSFAETVDAMNAALSPVTVCAACHGREKGREGHRLFFEQSDRLAIARAREMTTAIRGAQFEYARAATRVEDISRGVLIVQDEAIRMEDAKTALMALTAQAHTIDLDQIREGSQKTVDICAEVNASLDEKVAGLRQRQRSSILVWAFAVCFALLMFWKYRSLKHAMVITSGHTPAAAHAATVPRRRAIFDVLLAGMGFVALGSILWPAIAYLLPVNRRGGAAARVVAGKASEWAVWQVRKVSFSGKPVAVLRTPDGFRAFSAICTHLGCIVHWDTGSHVFACPCHAATFDDEGRVVSGPPPKPLARYDAREVQGDVIISEIA